MKKLTLYVMVMAMTLCCPLLTRADDAMNTSSSVSYVIYDEQTGDEIVLHTNDENTTCNYYTSVDGKMTVEYETILTVPIDTGINPRSGVTTQREEASIRATLRMTYYIYANRGTIKVTNVDGSWECINSTYSMSFSNRAVSVNDGRPYGTHSLSWNPTSNSFSYATGWNEVTYYPPSTDGASGARAYSEATGTIIGMGGSYTIYTLVTVQ